jgi:hypothetical protein
MGAEEIERVNWIRMAQDRVPWPGFVHVLMLFQVA